MKTEKQQSAVNFLVEELLYYADSDYAKGIIKQAKEMEKEQIIEFTNDYILTQCGASFEGNVEAGMLIEEYYKLTFKPE
jgi:hypothetical protein